LPSLASRETHERGGDRASAATARRLNAAAVLPHVLDREHGQKGVPGGLPLSAASAGNGRLGPHQAVLGDVVPEVEVLEA